jgi:FixJ family two-component response regulator
MSGMPIDVRTECSTKQADGFLSKPFNATVIVGHVNQWLNRVKQTTWGSLPQREEDIVTLKELQNRYIRHVFTLLSNNLPLTAEKLGVSQQTVAAATNDDTAR